MSKRIKIPKRVAGVKVPKAIRKGPVSDLVNSSGGQLLLAEALVAVAGLFAVKNINGEETGDVLSHPVDSLQRAGRKVGSRAGDAQAAMARNSARLQFALGEGVRAFREALADPSGPVIEPDVETGKKKRTGRRRNPRPRTDKR